jgi:hypothetical protein
MYQRAGVKLHHRGVPNALPEGFLLHDKQDEKRIASSANVPETSSVASPSVLPLPQSILRSAPAPLLNPKSMVTDVGPVELLGGGCEKGLSMTRDRGFESVFLQGRVRCEPDFGRPGSTSWTRERRSTRANCPLYAARIEDLGRGDVVTVDCAACHHVAWLTPEALLRARLSPAAKVLHLKARPRWQEEAQKQSYERRRRQKAAEEAALLIAAERAAAIARAKDLGPEEEQQFRREAEQIWDRQLSSDLIEKWLSWKTERIATDIEIARTEQASWEDEVAGLYGQQLRLSHEMGKMSIADASYQFLMDKFSVACDEHKEAKRAFKAKRREVDRLVATGSFWKAMARKSVPRLARRAIGARQNGHPISFERYLEIKSSFPIWVRYTATRVVRLIRGVIKWSLITILCIFVLYMCSLVDKASKQQGY